MRRVLFKILWGCLKTLEEDTKEGSSTTESPKHTSNRSHSHGVLLDLLSVYFTFIYIEIEMQ